MEHASSSRPEQNDTKSAYCRFRKMFRRFSLSELLEQMTELTIPNKNGLRNKPEQAAEKSVGFCRELGTGLRPPNRGGTVPASGANEKGRFLFEEKCPD